MDKSGVGTSRESFSYLVSFLQTAVVGTQLVRADECIRGSDGNTIRTKKVRSKLIKKGLILKEKRLTQFYASYESDQTKIVDEFNRSLFWFFLHLPQSSLMY